MSRFTHDRRRDAVWRVICDYLQRYVPAGSRVVDLGAGYCSFINNIRAEERHAVDQFSGFTAYAEAGVLTHVADCRDLHIIPDEYFDVVFESNLLEHLEGDDLLSVVSEIKRITKPSGRFIAIQPNFRFCYRRYFDDYTHRKVFTDASLVDFLQSHGFRVDEVFARFLPATFKSRLPTSPWLVWLYLRMAYRPFAGQMLVVAHKELHPSDQLK